MKNQKYTNDENGVKSLISYLFSRLLGAIGIGSYNENTRREYKQVMAQAKESSKRTKENLARADEVLRRAEKVINADDEIVNKPRPN